MFWTEEIKEQIDKYLSTSNDPTTVVINDSKTPSGEAHVGSLRGALIHDALFKTLSPHFHNITFLFGSDDYDPVDEIPKNQNSHFEKYLGQPLCNVPAPPDSTHPDMATHFISSFFEVFTKSSINPKLYRMRDIYRSGQFDEAIETILHNTPLIRNIYKSVSGSEKNNSWFPFQPICEACGRIGTTLTTNFDGKEVTYSCEPNIVKWAKGCGHKGKLSPFSGNGKLPWKLEWVAKWKTFNITLEGAGMDHTTKGGSWDVASSILKSVFSLKPPISIPYGFFLLNGSKMSSSKGIGATAKEMAAFLPTNILRFLMLRTPTKRAIDFSPDDKYITALFSDFDTTKLTAFSDKSDSGALARSIISVSEPNTQFSTSSPDFILSFSALKTLAQLPHINILKLSEQEKGTSLTPNERHLLTERLNSVNFWLHHYATEDDIFTIQAHLHTSFYQKATALQCGFLCLLLKTLTQNPYPSSSEEFQNLLFTTARLTPIPAKDAFKAIYLTFLNKEKGPLAGNLLFHLNPDTVLKQLSSVLVNNTDFLTQSSTSQDNFIASLTKDAQSISSLRFQHQPLSLDVIIHYTDGKPKLMRIASTHSTHNTTQHIHLIESELRSTIAKLFPHIQIV